MMRVALAVTRWRIVADSAPHDVRTAPAPVDEAARASIASGRGRASWLTLKGALAVLAMALAGSFIGYFLFTGMPQFTLQVFPRTLTNHIIIGALALTYVAYLAVGRRLPGGSPLDLPVLAFIGAYAIATLTSIDWRLSAEATLQIAAAIIVFYALSDLPLLTAASLRRAFMLVAVALSLYAIWIVGNDYADYVRLVRDVEGLNSGNIFPPTVPRVHDVSDHPNVLAMLIVLAMPLLAHAALRSAVVIERILAAAGFIAAALAIFLTLSRGGWLGAVAGVGFTLAGIFLTLRAHDREAQGFAPSWSNAIPRDISPTAVATLGGALVLAVGGTLAFLSNSSTRPGWLFRGSLSPREDAWESSLDMFGDYFLTGSGPHTFGLLYPQYSGQFLVHTQHAHNGFLQVANDAGIIGLIALISVALAAAYMLARVWREGALEQRLVAVALAGSLVGYSVHNLLDAGNMWKATGIALAALAAVIVRLYRERDDAAPASAPFAFDKRVTRYGRYAIGAAIVAVVLLPLLGWYRIDSAHHDYWLGVDRVNNNEPRAIEALQDAVNADGALMVNQLELGKAQANRYIRDGMQDRILLGAAIIHLEEAREIDPRSDIARANLARAYQLAGRHDDAAHEAQLARLSAHHVTPVLAVAEVYELMGDDDRAIDTYAQVIGMDAGLADSSFWEGSDWRRAHFDEILGASILGINPCTYGAFLAERQRRDAGAPVDELDDAADGCKLLVLDDPNDLVIRVNLAKILMAQGAMDEARGHLDYAVDRQPDFGPARTELGRWHAAEGNMEAAKSEWLRGVELDEAESVMLLGDTYPPGEVPGHLIDTLRDLVATSNSSVRNDLVSILYYRMRYGRLSPVWAMIDGDWQRAVPRLFEEMEQTLAAWEAR